MKPRNPRATRFFALAPVVALLPVALLAAALPDQTGRSVRCEAVLQPDSVRISPEPVQIGFTVPDSIGIVTLVSPDEGSGITVVNVDNEARAVTLNTQSAIEGAWAISFRGDSARTCIGNLNVMQGAIGRAR